MYIIGYSRIRVGSVLPLTYLLLTSYLPLIFPLLTHYFPFPLLILYSTPMREVLFMLQRYCFMRTYANNYVAKYATDVAAQQM